MPTKNFIIKNFTLYFLVLSFFLLYEFALNKEQVLQGYVDKINSIESTLESELLIAQQVLYGMAVTISQDDLMNNNSKLKELIQNFDPRNNINAISTLFSYFLIYNAEKKEIFNSLIPESHNKIHHRNNNKNFCLEGEEKKFFKLNVNQVMFKEYLNEEIIPFNIRISDMHNNYVGTICSGFMVKELNKKLRERFGYSRHTSGISIIKSQNNYKEFGLKSISSIQILKCFLFNRNLTIVYKMENYPILIEMKIKNFYFKNTMFRFILFSLLISVLYILSIYFIDRSYYSPLNEVQKKLLSFNQKTNNNIISSSSSNSTKYSLSQFASEVSTLIDNFYMIYLEKKSNQPAHIEIHKKIQNLIFIEQHFLSSEKAHISHEKLYLNKLLSIIDEDVVTMDLIDFFEQVSSYCCEFYHEYNIKIVVDEIDNKNFTFKKSALIETIFNIFTFISRGNPDLDGSTIILKGSFNDNHDFPSIIVEFSPREIQNSLGWNSGPDYVHTGLLSIYLSAKENNLFFNIEQKDSLLKFSIESIEKKIRFYDLAFESEA